MKKAEKSEPDLITGSELARRFGISEAAVRKAVRDGRIVPAMVSESGKRLFIEATAREQWNQKTFPAKATGRIPVATAGLPAGEDESEPESLQDATSARRIKMVGEMAKAKILSVQAKKLEGKMVDVAAVSIAWEAHVLKVKQLFLALPMDLRMHIPGLTLDNIKLIENRINDILGELAELTAEDLLGDDARD